MNKTLGTLSFATLGMILILVIVLTVWNFSKNNVDSVQPRIIEQVELESTTVPVGGTLVVHIKEYINLVCPAEVHWSIVRTEDNVAVSTHISPAKDAVLGENDIVSTRKLLDDVPPGKYYYIGTVYDVCGPTKKTYVSISSHTPFTIVKQQ